MVHLDRGETQPLHSGQRAGLANQPREGVPVLAVAEASEVHAREHDLAMTLRHPPANLGENRAGATAACAATNERDDAEGARERTAVLDLHERADPLDP